VVKNVAGYDLGKLFAGSYGTLGLIAEATFRLHPLPPAAAFVTLDCVDPQAAQDVMVAAAAAPVVPSAAEIHWPAATAPVSAAVLVEGDPDGVAEGAARLAGLLAEAASEGAADRPPRAADSPEPVLQPTAPAWWGRDALGGDGTMLRIAFWPGDLAAVLTATRAAAAEAGLDGAGPAVTVTGSAAAGVLHAEVPAAAPGAAAGRFVTALRDRLAAIGGDRPGPSVRASAIVLHAPAGSSDGLDFWGPVPSLPLMRAVKDQFDPEHRLAPGRFAGGI
jgi:glycolate oxidase FAD binding subunit